jgi:hypothetical protein
MQRQIARQTPIFALATVETIELLTVERRVLRSGHGALQDQLARHRNETAELHEAYRKLATNFIVQIQRIEDAVVAPLTAQADGPAGNNP